MSNKGIEEFSKLMSVLDDAEKGVVRKEITSGSVKSMDDILNRYNKALNEASELVGNTTDKRLKQVKDSKIVSESVIKIGDYSIIKENGLYSLLDENDTVLVDNVLVYETVYSIASHLYQGKTFSSSKIVSLLHNNSRYEKHLAEAKMSRANFNKYKNNNDYVMMDIEHTKFEENKHRAKIYKKNILHEYNNLGK